MKTVLFMLFISIRCLDAKIVIEVNADEENGTPSVSYSGLVVEDTSENDIKNFFSEVSLKDAVKIHYAIKPTNVYYKKPTPWGDLYTRYNWEEVSKIVSVKSARVKNFSKRPVVVSTQPFNNFRNHSVKINTGISHTVENTITTSWSESKELTVSQDIEYDVNVIFAKLIGTTGISYTSAWGRSEEKSESVTIGSTTSVETELQPEQTVTAELSVNSAVLEIEVVYKAYLRGNLAVNIKKKLDEHHFLGPRIQDVMKSAGVINEKSVVETIKFGFYFDGSLKVYDKDTGKRL